MRFRLLSLTTAALILAAPSTFAQIECDTQTCSFTLSFDSVHGGSVNEYRFVTGAPYTGQESYELKNTLQDGTHTITHSTSPLIYRDSRGRMRLERSVYNTANSMDGRPKPPDDFTVVEIHDPVAGYEYILDSVAHVAHRMAFKPGEPQKFISAGLDFADTPSFTTPRGLIINNEKLGPEAMFGAAAVGERRTTTRPAQTTAGQAVSTSEESWVDPKTGVFLSRKNSNPLGNGSTMTMLSYSNAEPDAALFQIPEGYKIVDETGPFKVVHTRTSAAPAFTSAGQVNPRSSADCTPNPAL